MSTDIRQSGPPVILSRITNVSTDQSAPHVTTWRRNVWLGPGTMKYVMCNTCIRKWPTRCKCV